MVLVCDQLWTHFWHNDEHWRSHKCIFVFRNRSAATSGGDKWYSLQKFFESAYYVFLCYQSTHVLESVQIYTDISYTYAVPKMELESQSSTVVYCERLVLHEVVSKVVWKLPINLCHLILHTLYWSYQVQGAILSDIKILGCKIPVRTWLTVQPALSSWRQLANTLAHADDW